MSNCIYILFSESLDRFYIGSTSDLNGRLRRHLSHHAGYTGSINDWRVVYTEQFPSKKEALQREKEIKNWKSKILIQKLISVGSDHPD